MTARRTSGTPPTVASLLDDEAHVARLTAHAGRLLHLQQQLELALPRQLTKVVRVANWRLGKLVLHAANGAVAAKLRQLLPGLVENYKRTGTEVNEIEVKVQPISHTQTKESDRLEPTLSDKSKQGLTSLSQKLPPDAPLKAVLERLIAKK